MPSEMEDEWKVLPYFFVSNIQIFLCFKHSTKEGALNVSLWRGRYGGCGEMIPERKDDQCVYITCTMFESHYVYV